MTQYLQMLAIAYALRELFGNTLCSRIICCGLTNRFYNDIKDVDSFVTFGNGA